MDVPALAAEVLRSKKYGGIDSAVVSRVCARMAAKHTNPKEALKAAKNELHMVHESFLQGDDCHKTASALLDRLTEGGDAPLEDVCAQIMRLHASTAERQRGLAEIYRFFSSYIHAGSAVMDIGCGFHPFAIPLLAERPLSYVAYDINTDTIQLVQRFFDFLQTPESLYRAEIFDCVPDTPPVSADVALLLKVLPVLQQQKKGRGLSLLGELKFGTAIVSFPTKSMAGRQKGMASFYAEWFEGNLPHSIEIAEKRVFSNEMFYVVGKGES